MQDLVVKRIDEGLGLILEVPLEPAVTPGFVHISNVGDTKIDKLQQVGLELCADLLPTISYHTIRMRILSKTSLLMHDIRCTGQGTYCMPC